MYPSTQQPIAAKIGIVTSITKMVMPVILITSLNLYMLIQSDFFMEHPYILFYLQNY